MLNFTVGPVQLSEEMKKIGGCDIPYFRTAEFSEIMFENESLMKEFVAADHKARVVFMTGSGTASMEAAVMGTLDQSDKVLIVNGGSFGERFVQLCGIHEIPHTEIKLEMGKTLTQDELERYDGKGYTAFLVNLCETSTGVLYDMRLISAFCRKNNLFLIVDAISSFLADDLKMKESGADIVITGSQKALACPPGISVIVMSERAVGRIESHRCRSMYLDLKSALKNGERGQTPFTPAVGILLQINARLRQIKRDGGIEEEKRKIEVLAKDFRERIVELPLEVFPETMSNAVTSLAVKHCSAYDIFTILKDEFGIWICPNGGELKDRIFRVGHIGNLTVEDNKKLVNALQELENRKLLR